VADVKLPEVGADSIARAKENDVLLLGECGLDPGIDSM
jgi:saccharopine dehydrogenase-like NADP-dependent oxidoreductase